MRANSKKQEIVDVRSRVVRKSDMNGSISPTLYSIERLFICDNLFLLPAELSICAVTILAAVLTPEASAPAKTVPKAAKPPRRNLCDHSHKSGSPSTGHPTTCAMMQFASNLKTKRLGLPADSCHTPYLTGGGIATLMSMVVTSKEEMHKRTMLRSAVLFVRRHHVLPRFHFVRRSTFV